MSAPETTVASCFEHQVTLSWNAEQHTVGGQTFTLSSDRTRRGPGSTTTTARNAEGKVVATHKSQQSWVAKTELIRKLNKLVKSPVVEKEVITAENLAEKGLLRAGMTFEVPNPDGKTRTLTIHKAGAKTVTYSHWGETRRQELEVFLANYIWDLSLEQKLAIFNQ